MSPESIKEQLAQLTKKFEDIVEQKKKLNFHKENEACIDSIISVGQGYIKLAGDPEYKESFKKLMNRARKYLSGAKRFLATHQPHSHSHDRKKH